MKFLSEAEQLGIVDALGARRRAISLLLVAGERPMARAVLGQLRLDLGRPPVSEGLAVHVDRRLPAVRRRRRRRPPDPRAPPVHDAAPRRHRPARVRSAVGALAVVRPRAQRLGARLGQRAYPPPRHAAAHLLAARHRPRGRAEALRLPARRVPVRRAAARGLRRRHRPLRRDPRRRGEHPRGDRVPEDAVRRRPADQRPHPDRPHATPRPRPQTPDNPRPERRRKPLQQLVRRWRGRIRASKLRPNRDGVSGGP